MPVSENDCGRSKNSNDSKKNSLFFFTGPPTVKPYSFRLMRSFAGALQTIKEVAGFEGRVAVGFVEPAVELVGAALGDELDLHRAFAERIRAGGRRAHGHFFNRLRARLNGVENRVRIALGRIVLHVDAIDGDVDRGLRQAVDGGVADSIGALRAWLGRRSTP